MVLRIQFVLASEGRQDGRVDAASAGSPVVDRSSQLQTSSSAQHLDPVCRGS